MLFSILTFFAAGGVRMGNAWTIRLAATAIFATTFIIFILIKAHVALWTLTWLCQVFHINSHDKAIILVYHFYQINYIFRLDRWVNCIYILVGNYDFVSELKCLIHQFCHDQLNQFKIAVIHYLMLYYVQESIQEQRAVCNLRL